jgi:WD40 repeat protein
MEFSPDGRFVLASFWDRFSRSPKRGQASRHLRLWNLVTGAEVAWPGNGGDTAFFSLDGKLVATMSPNQHMLLWDVANGATPSPLPDSNELTSEHVARASFGPDNRVVLTSLDGRSMSLWGTSPARLQCRSPLTSPSRTRPSSARTAS